METLKAMCELPLHFQWTQLSVVWTQLYTSIVFSFTSHSYAILHYAICIVISWFRKNRHSKREEGARRRPSEPGGSIIVRRLICLLYTAGGLLSGIPFYGPYVVYRASVRRQGGAPLRTRHMLLHHVAHCRRGATPALCWVGTVSVGERWAWRASWGALIAYHLTLSGQDLSLTACGLRHPAAGSRRDV